MARTIKDQTVEELGGDGSVLARQRREHAEMDRLMDRYQRLTDSEEQARLLKEIVQLVFSHAFAEETVLWPAVRCSVPDGEELTARVEQEHQQINDLTSEIERLDPQDPRRDEMVRRVFALIRQDIRDEEDELLPRLQDALNPAGLRRLGAAWEAVRRSAPTRPHPAVPRRPPGNALLGIPLSGYDRARDALGASTGSTAGRRRAAVVLGLLAAASAVVTVVVRGVRVTRRR
ncbi:hemerythrin domain-containing protein [Streptomyces candidus]|uniref:Hemerythrin superfamily protein n=1 Tax=Streptomyces candidus TaxID=67283 RepID=A0A7X0HIY5_9ACTN|nr:hemerythrin domain-containing protein [Streptomyces candidus]MBB6438534.1 hemerythrin superfamily protein [Streptomyces candidus]GHH45549.1 hemerythrin [Streptomyces candidus]